MKALDKHFLLAAAIVAVAASTVYVLEVRKLSPLDVDWRISSVIGVFIVSVGALSSALALFMVWFALTTRDPFGRWLKLQLVFANLLKLCVSIVIISVGIRLGNWIDLPSNIPINPQFIFVMAILALLAFIAYVMDAMTARNARD